MSVLVFKAELLGQATAALKVYAVADNARYSCETTSVAFKATMMLQRRLKEVGEKARKELEAEQVLRVDVEGEVGRLKGMVRDMAGVRVKEAAQWTKTETAVDDLRDAMRMDREDSAFSRWELQGVVQTLVDNEEVCKNRVRAHGGLLKQLLKDVNGLGWGGLCRVTGWLPVNRHCWARCNRLT